MYMQSSAEIYKFVQIAQNLFTLTHLREHRFRYKTKSGGIVIKIQQFKTIAY